MSTYTFVPLTDERHAERMANLASLWLKDPNVDPAGKLKDIARHHLARADDICENRRHEISPASVAEHEDCARVAINIIKGGEWFDFARSKMKR